MGEAGFGLVGVVEDLDGREADADLAAESLVAEVSRLPVLAPVCENGQAGNRTTIAIVEAVVVGEQAFGEIGVVLALDFDVDVDLWFSMVVCSEPSDHDNAAERLSLIHIFKTLKGSCGRIWRTIWLRAKDLLGRYRAARLLVVVLR